MSTTDKIVAYVDGQAIPEPSECFAIRGQTIIDVINPATGLTVIYGKTLEECQQGEGHEHVERMTIDEFCQDKAAAQDAPVVWEPTTEERYDEMLGVLPPALYTEVGFLVGEPWDHHALTGQPRYQAFAALRGVKAYYVASRPMTKKEFLKVTAVSIYNGKVN